MNTKILYPNKPSECVAAMSLSEDGEEHPYLSIFYTVNEGRIRFFGLRVMGTEVVEAEREGEDESERRSSRPSGPGHHARTAPVDKHIDHKS